MTADEVDAYLRRHEKIPSFLEIRESPGKGLGVFATEDINDTTQSTSYLGIYLGEYMGKHYSKQHAEELEKRDYLMHIITDGVSYGYTDAQDISESNWTRFINDGAHPNCTDYVMGYFKPKRFFVAIFADKDIKKGEELIMHYGGNYWEHDTSSSFKE